MTLIIARAVILAIINNIKYRYLYGWHIEPEPHRMRYIGMYVIKKFCVMVEINFANA